MSSASKVNEVELGVSSVIGFNLICTHGGMRCETKRCKNLQIHIFILKKHAFGPSKRRAIPPARKEPLFPELWE